MVCVLWQLGFRADSKPGSAVRWLHSQAAAVLGSLAATAAVDCASKLPYRAFVSTGDGPGMARTLSVHGVSGDSVPAMHDEEAPALRRSAAAGHTMSNEAGLD
jgi:hypothetical protein